MKDTNGKGFGTRCVESLLFLAAADLGALLVKFLIQMITVPIRRELDARKAVEALAAVDKLLSLLCIAGFFAVLAVFIAKNPVYKGRYLNDSYGERYSFFADFARSAKEKVLPDLLMTALMGTPQYAVLLIWGDVNYLPLLFPPFHAVWELTGSPVVSWLLMSAAVPAFNLAVTLAAHRVWEKGRLRK